MTLFLAATRKDAQERHLVAAVALSVSGAPAGVTATVTPSATGGMLTLSVGATVRPGRYVLAVTGDCKSLMSPSRMSTTPTAWILAPLAVPAFHAAA